MANICNAIAWLYLAYRMTKEEWIYNLDIIIYATVLCVPVIIAIATAMWTKKQKDIQRRQLQRSKIKSSPVNSRETFQDKFESL